MEILKDESLATVVGGTNHLITDVNMTTGDKIRVFADSYVIGLCTGPLGIYGGLKVIGDSKVKMVQGCGRIAGGCTILGAAAYGIYKLGEKIGKKIFK